MDTRDWSIWLYHTTTHIYIYKYDIILAGTLKKCVCVCAYTYIRTYVRTYIHTSIYIYIYTYIHTYIHIYIYIHTCIHTYIQTYIHTYIYIYIHTLHYTTLHYITLHDITLHTYIHIYIHTYIYTIYIHIYTWTLIFVFCFWPLGPQVPDLQSPNLRPCFLHLEASRWDDSKGKIMTSTWDCLCDIMGKSEDITLIYIYIITYI